MNKPRKIIFSLLMIYLSMAAAIKESVHEKDPEDIAKSIKAKHYKPQVLSNKGKDVTTENNADLLQFEDERENNPDRNDEPINEERPEKKPDSKEEKYKEHEEIASSILKKRANYTSCEEFLDHTKLDISKVIDIQWKVVYYWLPKDQISNSFHYFSFKLPTETLVDRFKSELAEELKGVNWTAAELFLENSMDFSAIFIATKISGLYTIIPSIGFEYEIKNDDLQNYFFAMKLVEPHYLGMLNCRYRQVLALAPQDKMPKKKEIKSMLEKFNIRSDFGMSYLELEKYLESEISPKAPKNDERELDLYDGVAPKDMDLNAMPIL